MPPLIPLEPLGDIVIVVPYEVPIATGHNGQPLILPDMYRRSRATQMSTVVAVGPGKLDDEGNRVPMPEAIRVGAVIGHAKNTGSDVNWNGVKLTMMRAEHIGAEVID